MNVSINVYCTHRQSGGGSLEPALGETGLKTLVVGKGKSDYYNLPSWGWDLSKSPAVNLTSFRLIKDSAAISRRAGGRGQLVLSSVKIITIVDNWSR